VKINFRKSFICGIKSTKLSKKEYKFLKKYKPWGIILFQRNIDNINQVTKLTTSIKNIFKDTTYEKYITIKSGYSCNINLDPAFKKRYDISFNHLKEYISDPPKSKEISAIIYNIANITNNKIYNLNFLSEKCGVSKNIISNEANKIKNFYNNNPNLKTQILNS